MDENPPYPPPQDYNPFYDRDENINVNDQFEFLTRFAMEQNLAHYGYGDKLSHINKNILFTNLSRKDGEVDKVVKLLEIITILKRFQRRKKVLVPSGQFEKIGENEENVAAREILIEQEIVYFRFNNMQDYFSTKLYATTSAAAGENSSLAKLMKSSFVHKEQSIEDKTETRAGFWAKPKNNRGGN